MRFGDQVFPARTRRFGLRYMSTVLVCVAHPATLLAFSSDLCLRAAANLRALRNLHLAVMVPCLPLWIESPPWCSGACFIDTRLTVLVLLQADKVAEDLRLAKKVSEDKVPMAKAAAEQAPANQAAFEDKAAGAVSDAQSAADKRAEADKAAVADFMKYLKGSQ